MRRSSLDTGDKAEERTQDVVLQKKQRKAKGLEAAIDIKEDTHIPHFLGLRHEKSAQKTQLSQGSCPLGKTDEE